IEAVSSVLKESSTNTTIHTTFLDPYVLGSEIGRAAYGLNSDWSDNYFAHDVSDSLPPWSLTEGVIENAFNVDVTWLDPVVAGADAELFPGTPSSSHGWPYA